MRIRGMGETAQKAHIPAVKGFAKFMKRSPDTATPDELCAYQLHMTNAGVSQMTFNARIVALRFFFGMTCGREEMKHFMQFRTQPKKLPVMFSVEEVQDSPMAAPRPGFKYRAALSISYGAGLRAAEVCNLKLCDIDSDRMLINVERFCRKLSQLILIGQEPAVISGSVETSMAISFKGVRFPKPVILFAVYFYVRQGVSHLDLEEIMEERRVFVNHATLNRLVARYAGLIAEKIPSSKTAARSDLAEG